MGLTRSFNVSRCFFSVFFLFVCCDDLVRNCMNPGAVEQPLDGEEEDGRGKKSTSSKSEHGDGVWRCDDDVIEMWDHVDVPRTIAKPLLQHGGGRLEPYSHERVKGSIRVRVGTYAPFVRIKGRAPTPSPETRQGACGGCSDDLT